MNRRPASSMIYGVKDSSRYVYHYTTAEIAETFILRNRTILLSSFANTNDPKESRTWNFGLRYRDMSKIDSVDSVGISASFSNLLKLNSRLSCFCTDQDVLTGDHTRDILLRGFSRPRMWAQYANKHSGVCIVLDKSILIERMSEAFPGARISYGPVEYRNRSPFLNLSDAAFQIDLDTYLRVGADEYAKRHLDTHRKELFFEKLLDWRDETEWRIVLLDSSTEKCYLPIGDSIVGVIHGAAMSRQTTERLIAIADEPQIEHMGLLWNNHAPWYDIGGNIWLYEDRRVIERMEARKASAPRT